MKKFFLSIYKSLYFLKFLYNFFFIIFFFLFSFSSFSQFTNKINAKVLDKKNNSPISFATIILKKNGLGLYANDDGDFSINMSERYVKDTLIISSIGYKKKYVPIILLLEKKQNIIYLEEANEELSAITVSTKKRKIKLSSRSIIREAIKRIPKNYPTEKNTFISYYRDYLKKNGEYYNLNEAIVQTIDSGFLTPHYKSKFRLLDYKKNKEFQRISFIPDKYDTIWQTPDYSYPNKYIPFAKLPNQGGNELFILLVHDPIRNFEANSFSFIYKFSRDFLRNHSFQRPIKTYNDYVELYKINFSTMKNIIDRGDIPNPKGFVPENKSHYVINSKGEEVTDAVLVSGEIYINPKDFTIHKIIYKGVLKSTNKKIYELVLEYGYKDFKEEEMQLKYISFNNEFFTLDHNDENVFKIIGYKRKSNFLELTTNTPIDIKSAKEKSYYRISYENIQKEIKKIEISGSTIRIYLEKPELIKLGLKIEVRNIRDINGRVINEKKVVAFYQFRELFVQEYNKELDFKNKCYLKNIPLYNNCISSLKGESNFLMNTPFYKEKSLKD